MPKSDAPVPGPGQYRTRFPVTANLYYSFNIGLFHVVMLAG